MDWFLDCYNWAIGHSLVMPAIGYIILFFAIMIAWTGTVVWATWKVFTCGMNIIKKWWKE